VFGLAGLCYFAVRKRTPQHMLMAALAALPFLVYWLSAFAKPVIIHVRFFSFPMLVCCLYAALFLVDIVRKRWIRLVMFAVLLIAGYQRGLVRETLEKVAADTIIKNDRDQSLSEVRKLAQESEIVLCGRSLGFLCYHLGERESGRIVQFREVLSNDAPLRCIRKGAAVFIEGDLGGSDGAYLCLAVPHVYKIDSFLFFPVFRTADKCCVVYSMQRTSNQPLPADCFENSGQR
jgi:hypothetical protein